MSTLISEAIPPCQNKGVAFMMGRMQPPTKGHYKVIDKMKEFIRENPSLKLEAKPIVIIINGGKSSHDKIKNPLTVDDRISIMQSSGNANGVIFISAKNAFDAIVQMRKKGFEPIAIGAGSDRAKSYMDLLTKSFPLTSDHSGERVIISGLNRDNVSSNDKKIDKDKAISNALAKLEINGDLEDDEISGSIARRAVELGWVDEFAEIVGLGKKPELAKILFKKLKKAFASGENNK